MRESIRVLILCGGQGTHLASVLGDVPKALAPINGRPFLDYQLDVLYRARFSAIVLCTGVGHDQIAAHCRSCWGTNIHTSHEPEPRGTAGALRPRVGDGHGAGGERGHVCHGRLPRHE